MDNQGFAYNVDIVFCIDVTGSMSPVINRVKENTRKFADDLVRKMAEKDKRASSIRVRVIAFGDFEADSNPINTTGFLSLLPPNDVGEFERFVDSLKAGGGGTEPESGLEALAIAMASDWTSEGDKRRHVIVMFTDASAHPLEARVGTVPAAFTSDVPASFDILTDRWHSGQASSSFAPKLEQAAARLIIYAPDTDPWTKIGDDWEQALFYPSRAGEGLSEVDYDVIVTAVSNTLG